MNSSKVISLLLLGAAIGVAASWKIAQKKSKKEADEDVASVKKAYGESLDEYKEMFNDYRNKVIAKYGEEVDQQFMGPIKNELGIHSPSGNPLEDVANNEQYRQIIQNCGYSADQPKTNYAQVEDVNDREVKDLPYVIREDCYGEKDEYVRIELRYDIDMSANEIRLYDETTNEDEDAMTIFGKDVLEFVDNQLEYHSLNGSDSEETAMLYVRDDVMRTDYKVEVYRW